MILQKLSPLPVLLILTQYSMASEADNCRVAKKSAI